MSTDAANSPAVQGSESVAFGGGCFWCTEAVFARMKGVRSVTPGYTGGTTDSPTYEDVCSGVTGHAEAVLVEYDPSLVRFDDLLTVFFATHDPTTLDRQGNDVGTQYRSAIFYRTDIQRKLSLEFIGALDSSMPEGSPIVTEIARLERFFPAEDDHRDYFARHPEQAYCQVVINPKLEKLQSKFADLLKDPKQ